MRANSFDPSRDPEFHGGAPPGLAGPQQHGAMGAMGSGFGDPTFDEAQSMAPTAYHQQSPAYQPEYESGCVGERSAQIRPSSLPQLSLPNTFPPPTGTVDAAINRRLASPSVGFIVHALLTRPRLLF